MQNYRSNDYIFSNQKSNYHMMYLSLNISLQKYLVLITNLVH